MRILAPAADDSGDNNDEAMTDAAALDDIMNKGIAKKGLADAATIELQLQPAFRAYFTEKLHDLGGRVADLIALRERWADEAQKIQKELARVAGSSTRHTLAFPKEFLARLGIIAGISMGVLIAIIDGSSLLHYLIPITDSSLKALFWCGVVFSVPVVEGLILAYSKVLTEKFRERLLLGQFLLTSVLLLAFLYFTLRYGNVTGSLFGASRCGLSEFVPMLRMLFQVLTAIAAAGVAFGVAVSNLVRLPAENEHYLALEKKLTEANAEKDRAQARVYPLQGKINRMEEQIRVQLQKTSGRLQHDARLDEKYDAEKKRATDDLHS